MADGTGPRQLMPGLTVRAATPDDAPALVALINSAYRGESSKAGWTTEADMIGGQRIDVGWLIEMIEAPGSVILLHEQDDGPMACVQLARMGEDCYLGLLTVRPTRQGSGMGGRLLDAAERWAAEQWACTSIHMTVIVQRTELLAWYTRRGYALTGQRKPFPYGDERFGLPQRDDLAFELLRKELSPVHIRRRRYAGRNPRQFHDKYKELNPERYAADVEKIRASGKTPAGTHLPIMVDEVLACLRPAAGEVAVDCTLGGGGHARAILERVRPGGRVIGLDLDPLELPRTEARLRKDGFGPEEFVARQANFAGLPKALAAEGLTAVDIVLADLGVSSMQFDNPDRGFSYKGVGPLDMRMNPQRGESAAQLIARATQAELARLLEENADEPHAQIVAGLLKQQRLDTTHAVERLVRTGLGAALPRLSKTDIKMSVRRTFQALRIAVNDEFAALDALLRSLPLCLAPGGRVAFLTFHSGEDRRVKKALQAGYRAKIFAAVADQVIRSTKAETFSNRRASSAKLRWAVRADAPEHS